MIYLRNTTESQKIYIERQSIQTADTREINYITSGDVINIVDEKLEPYSTTEEVEGMISSAISGTVTEEQMNQAIQSAKTEIEAEIPSLDGYATEEWVQEQGYLTEHQSLSAYSTTEQVEGMISSATSGMATEEWVESQGYLTEHQSLSAYSTTEEMNTAIDNAVSGKQDTLISGTNIKTINGESILGSGNVEVITDLSDYWTSAETNSAIENAIASESARCESTYLKEHQSLSAYSTTEQMNEAIATAKGEVEAEIPDVSGFVTSGEVKTQIEGYNYVNSGEVDTQINDKIAIESARTDTAIENAIASESARCESTYLKEHQSLSAYSTTTQVEGMISSATSGMATEEWVQEQGYITEHQELSGLFADVQYVSADKKIYFYDKNNTLVGQVDTTDFIKDGMVDNVYISGETLYIVFNTDAGKETIELDLTDIFDASNYYTKTEVDNLFAVESARTESTYLKEHQSLSAYSTTEQVEGMISSATEDMATETWVGEQGYLTEHQSLSAYSTTEQMNTAIATAKGEVEAEIPDVSEFVTSGDVKTQIDNAGLATSGDLVTVERVVAGAVDELNTNKQDVLVSGTNIKTINNQSILGSGNIEIQGGGSYSAGTNIDITDNVISVTGIVVPDVSEFVTSADVKTQVEEYNYITSADAKSQIEEYNYITSANVETQINTALEDYYTSADTDTKIEEAIATESARCETTYLKEHQSLSAYSTTEQMNTSIDSAVGAESARTDTAIDTAIASESARCESTYLKEHQSLDNYYTSAETNTAINTALEGYYTSAQTDNLLTGKQDTLISGTNIKTINNQSLLGSGNIDIQGGSGGSTNVIELTKAEYDALTSYTEDAIYVITDAETVDLNDFATSADVQTLSGNVSNKVDKINTTASSNGYRTPKWNNQGQVTGYTQLYTSMLTINGNSNETIKTSNSGYPSIFAPTSAGSAGQPLLSAGSGAPTWATFKFWYGTQSQYDAITTKDGDTIYFVKDD